jgi:hypothetical protein
MFRKKPSPELEAIQREAEEIGVTNAERKSVLDRLIAKLHDPITAEERHAFNALLNADERRDCPAVLQMRIYR